MLVLIATALCIKVLIYDKYLAPPVIFLSIVILSFEYWLYARIKRVSLDGAVVPSILAFVKLAVVWCVGQTGWCALDVSGGATNCSIQLAESDWSPAQVAGTVNVPSVVVFVVVRSVIVAFHCDGAIRVYA